MPYSVTRYETHDADEQAEMLESWDQRYEQLSAGPFAGSLVEVTFDSVRLFREKTTQSVQQHGSPGHGRRAFSVGLALSDVARWRGLMVDTNDLINVAADMELDLRTPTECDCMAVEVDSDDFAAYAKLMQQLDTDRTLKGNAVVPTGAGKQQALKAFLRDTLTTLAADPSCLEHEAARRDLREQVYARLLESIAWGTQDRSPAAPGRRDFLARKAQEFVRAHIDQAFSMRELCAYVGCSRRTLQYCFQEAFGINPIAYVRAARLNGVRRAIRATSGQAAIQDVAAQWGFWHLSHFCEAYKEMFGELPSVTQRHSRAVGRAVPLVRAQGSPIP